MRISDWSSDVCSSDLPAVTGRVDGGGAAVGTILKVEGINTFYGKSHILNDASLDVRDGEIVALLGRYGAGKSALLKTLAGLVPAASGSMTFEGQQLVGMAAADIARRGVGYVPQGRGIFAEIGSAHVCTPVTKAHIVCRLLLDKKTY